MTRVPLVFSNDRLTLLCIVSCPRLRIPYRLMAFIIDTGSTQSFLSAEETLKLQVPVRERKGVGMVDVGGSRYERLELPPMTLQLIAEDKNSNISLDMELSALKTNKLAPENISIAYQLPCILGIDFLQKQGIELHIIPKEQMAFLTV